MASMILIIFTITGVHTISLVHFQMSRIEGGLRSTSGIVMTTQMPSVSACVLLGTSLDNCHAVNYDTARLLCEVISMHDSLLEMQNNTSYVFAAINNTNGILDTGVGSICVQGPVQWKEQSSWQYIALENMVYCDEGRYVCKVTIGDNEIPGVLDTDRKCYFVYKDLLGESGLYRTLTMHPDSRLAATWLSYRVGDNVPEVAFVGGHLSPGNPLYVCRATVNGIQSVGYYAPSKGLAYIPYVPSGSVQYPTTVDLLIFSPNGPTSVGPTTGWPCPRFHVQIASHAYEYIEHYGDMPSWAVTSNNQHAVGESAGVFSTPAKFNDFDNKYYFVYGELTGYHTWGHLLKTSLPYRWEPFQVGSDVPYNAFLGAYTIENEPLFIVMKDTFDHAIGTYNPKTKIAQMEYWGIRNPTSFHILTLFQPPGSSAWSDADYNTYSGPITALRIQHGTTVTGIQCRFGAQWSAGFGSKNSLKTTTEIDFENDEYIKGVKIGLSDTLEHLKLFTNLDTYGPFGEARGDTNISMFTRCGQVHHFSGYLRWDENEQMNKTFSFAVHGDICT